MRTFLFGIGLLLASASAWGQELVPRRTITLTDDQAAMIVTTLKQVACPTVAALETCNAVAVIIREIQDQVNAAKAQSK